MLIKGVCLLHDNARPCTAVITILLESFGWNVLHHPVHSPSDFHLFLYLKQHLAGNTSETDEEMEEEVRKWLREAAHDFYDKGIKDFVPWLTTRLEWNSDYVEK